MGTWSAGLYTDDFALDLRPMISAVCRLPIDGPEIVSLLADLNPAAGEAGDEEHTTFWLVLADQLQRRGIASPARQRALEIIDAGTDLARCENLGMKPSLLAVRRRNLDKLRQSIASPPDPKVRKTLAKPQRLVLCAGDIYAYPVDSRGNCINPYFSDKQRARFVAAGWSTFAVLRAGHALGYLAWYEFAASRRVTHTKTNIRTARSDITSSRTGIGTLSKIHANRMLLDRLGEIEGPPQLAAAPPNTHLLATVTADVSVSNLLSRWEPIGTFP